MTTPEDTAITFPCDFTLKIMGKADDDFEETVIAIVKKHFPKTTDDLIQKKLSKNNGFLSISATVHPESKAELDALYRELTSHPQVKMVL